MTDSNAILTEMNDRSREVFRRVVEGYLDNGEPVGSRTQPAISVKKSVPRPSETLCKI